MTPAEAITRHFGGDWNGTWGAFPTPGHSPKDRGTTVRDAENFDDVVFHCHNGDLDWKALKDDCRTRGLLPQRDQLNRPTQIRQTGRYEYTDADGVTVYQTVRLEKAGERKRFIAQRPNGRGGWTPRSTPGVNWRSNRNWRDAPTSQANPAADAILRAMLSRNLALEIDRAAINGKGTGAEPRGVLNDPDISVVPFNTDLFKTSAAMIAKADLANVGSTRSFLSTNGVKARASLLLDGQGRVIPLSETFHNETTRFSNQVPNALGAGKDEHGLIYGDWADFLIGIWSQLDILVNPYAETAYSKGNILIRAMATVDYGVRRPASFVKATGVKAA